MAFELDMKEDDDSLIIISDKKKKVICKFRKGDHFDDR
ncbi:MAG: hypothetical protein K0Q53_139 [Massilibacillus sp.]|jgi:hypothetical protein|nr:hypothetical protein [Massilibacillus sp.]